MSEQANPSVEVDVMVTGRVPIPRAYAFRSTKRGRVGRTAAILRPGGDVLKSPCLAYAVRHPSAGTILIDTGFHSDATDSRRKDFGTRMALLFRSLEPADMPYEEQLLRLGIEASKVARVIMTHLHVDHTSGMRLLPRAEFLIARDEWTAATSRGAGGRGYVAHHLPAKSQVELVDFEAGGERHGRFASTVDLLGDGSIRLIATPGHTKGHLSVLLRAGGGRQVLVVGDAVYTLRSLREELLPLLTFNDELYLRSLRELKAFCEEEPDAILVPSHDPTAWHALREVTSSTEKGLSAAP